jgi:amidase
MAEAKTWQEYAAAHREVQKSAIPAKWTLDADQLVQLSGDGKLIEGDVVRKSGLLTDNELTVTENYNASELLDKISNRKLSSEEVTEAFCKRAALAQQLVS